VKLKGTISAAARKKIAAYLRAVSLVTRNFGSQRELPDLIELTIHCD